MRFRAAPEETDLSKGDDILALEANDRVMHAVLDRQRLNDAGRVFVRMNEATLSYGDLARQSKALAASLIDLCEVKKGDRVAIFMANCLEYFVVQFAVSRAGGILVLVNALATGDVLANVLDNCDPAVIVADLDLLGVLEACGSSAVGHAQLLVRGVHAEPAPAKSGEVTSLKSAIERDSPDASLPQVSWTDPVDIFYTSGSTGEAKGVVLAQNHHYVFGKTIIRCNAMTADDVMYICLPLYHGLGSYMSIMPVLLCGGSIALAEKFSASGWLDDIRRYGATVTWSVSSLAPIILKQPQSGADADNPLRVYNYIGMPEELREQFEKRFAVTCVEHFGSTEVGHLAFTDGGRPDGYIGRINDEYFDVRIVDENDCEVPVGTPGECVSRPREPFIQMMGYFNKPEATLEFMRNCWMHSGDLCRVNEDGFIQYVGRNRDMIRRRGENIPAFELEKLLFANANVSECAAIPVPSQMGEDEIKLVICLRKRGGGEVEELIGYCRQNLPKYMFPQYIEIVDEMPRLANEKMDKQRLRENWMTPQTYDVERNAFLDG